MPIEAATSAEPGQRKVCGYSLRDVEGFVGEAFSEEMSLVDFNNKNLASQLLVRSAAGSMGLLFGR